MIEPSTMPSNSYSLEEVMDNSYDSIFVTDAVGNILMANPTAERLLNLTITQMVGRNIRELVEQGHWDKSIALEAIEKRTTVTGMIKTRDGINLMCTSRPLFDSQGNITMVISNSRDRDTLVKLAQTLDKERELVQRYKEEVQYLREQGVKDRHLVAESTAMKNLLLEANWVGPTESSVLLYGESGTGKEILAKYIYSISRRAKEAFITVNCSAIPENLIEAELFGYEKGSFTGADAKGKPGLFELADRGTIFLDEIGEMPLVLQAKLLRVLENGEVRRLGGIHSRKVDFRLICATNRDLKKMVEHKTFREDLFYRINVVPLQLAPLRDRPEDIMAISDVLLKELNKKYGYDKVFSTETLKGFLNYSWPGNVRELRNLIERLAITTRGRVIDYQVEEMSYPPGNRAAGSHQEEKGTMRIQVKAKAPLKKVMSQVEQEYIKNTLQDCQGCVSEAARILGIDRSAIYRKVQVVQLRDQD
ncbi:sigma-54 interaction domain-containing protein [Desulfitobacterium chlororespirans]|uniref:PAS modulated sigma54 specific transcriptional regulator, Fis family n=1 Tax=Desulfitobacterium chlororespirans DSM 11544 TaxID=1121395 RepID=A0A1M7RY57_9FIRM|nr:sigma 54-interacting transcriptional regulator [Desulfitobacterium chlororespirans]SHN51002.1 PAS modulated sigma54 specific transcriptional regulator, Fis family [Desulfitobacterium chlororespirans DSM 11544]